MDSIDAIEAFFQAEFGTEVGARDVAALPPDQLEDLLLRIFDETCTGHLGTRQDPVPALPEQGRSWSAAFHAPSALFRPTRVIDHVTRLLPMVLYFDEIALLDPLGVVAHYGPPDEVWQQSRVLRMLQKKREPSRTAFERLRRVRATQATRVLEEIRHVRDCVRLLPAGNWGSVCAGAVWDYRIQEWSIMRAMDADEGSSLRNDPIPDPSAAYADYLRSAGASVISADERSWDQALASVVSKGEMRHGEQLASLLLARPLSHSGRDLHSLVETDEILREVRWRLSTALEVASHSDSEDAIEAVRDVFREAASRLESRRSSKWSGVEVVAGFLGIGGVILDVRLSGSVDPSAAVGALAAQLPLLHGVSAHRARASQDSALRGAMIRLASALEVSELPLFAETGPMTRFARRALLARVLEDQLGMCLRAKIWPPRILCGQQILVDALYEWMWDQSGAPARADATITLDQRLFDDAVNMVESVLPIEERGGTWALTVADALQTVAERHATVVGHSPTTLKLSQPSL